VLPGSAVFAWSGGFVAGPVLQLVAPWSSGGGFVFCLVGGF